MSRYAALLKELQQTAKEYVTKERTRLENEASVLEAVLKGRTAGKGIQLTPITMVASVTKRSIADYLSGK